MDHSSTGKDADSNLKANPLKVEWKGGEVFVDLDFGLDSFVRLAYMTELRSKIAIKLDEVSLQHGCWKGKQKWLIPGKWIQKDIEIYFIVGYFSSSFFIYKQFNFLAGL